MRNIKRYIVALDIGTSSTRALLYDTSGRLEPGHEVKEEYKQHYTSDGGVECDPDQLLKLTLKALRGLIQLTDRKLRAQIAAVGISCFWHAIMGIDSNGDAVTALYSWADTRPSIEVPALNKTFDTSKYHAATGAFIHPCFWPAKIEWLRKTHPKASKIARWISFPDYLALKLCGECETSVSIASATGLMNRETAKWDELVLSKLSINAKELPKIAPDSETFNFVNGRLRGLPDIPWHFAFGDGACSNIGAGGTTEKRLVINVSTSGAARFVCDDPCEVLPAGLFGYRHDTHRHVIGGAISNGGNVYAWLTRTLQLPHEPGIENAVRKLKPAAHGLTVLPFWAGERSPGWHASAEASILGMRLSTTPIELVQASMESIAYSIRQIRDMISGTYKQAFEVIVSGGAVDNSRYVQQLLADVLNTSVRVSLDSEPSGRGAALAVAEKIGELKSISDSRDVLSRPIKPDSESVEAHERAYQTYELAYKRLIDNA